MKIVIYSVNDVYDFSNLARLRAFADDHNEKVKPDAHFLTLNGDFLSPSLISALDKGKSMVKVINACRIDHICLGNHDFDPPLEEVHKRLEEYQGVCVNSNIRFLDGKKYKTVPYDVSDVNGFKVGWLGLCTTQTLDLLKAARGKEQPLEIDDVLSVYKQHAKALRAAHPDVGYIVAMTHQFVQQDRSMAEGGAVDVILGGHEHDPYMEHINNTHIVKVGQDATHVGVVTINVDDESRVATTTAERVSLRGYRLDSGVQKAGEGGRALLEQFDHFVVLDPPADGQAILSSKNERIGPCSLGTLFADKVRGFYHADACLIPGGKLRGKKVYPHGLTLTDVGRVELPFPDNQVFVAKMTGRDLSECVRYSRTEAYGQGGYLQCDSQCVYDAKAGAVVSVRGGALDDGKTYRIAVPLSMLKGMDKNPVLTRVGERMKVSETVHTSDLLTLQEVVSMELVNAKWEQLGPLFSDADANGDCKVTKEEFRLYAASKLGLQGDTIDVFFRTLDDDKDGELSLAEFDNRLASYHSAQHLNGGELCVVDVEAMRVALDSPDGYTREQMRSELKGLGLGAGASERLVNDYFDANGNGNGNGNDDTVTGHGFAKEYARMQRYNIVKALVTTVRGAEDAKGNVQMQMQMSDEDATEIDAKRVEAEFCRYLGEYTAKREIAGLGAQPWTDKRVAGWYMASLQ